MAKMSKEEMKWWIEDNKGKFYTICGVLGVALVVGGFAVLSMFQPEPVIEAPTEDQYEEIDVGGFDVEEQIQKEEDAEDTKQSKEFGEKLEIVGCNFDEVASSISTQGYCVVGVLVGMDKKPCKLYVDGNTFESGVLTESVRLLLENNKGVTSLRCKLGDLPSETRDTLAQSGVELPSDVKVATSPVYLCDVKSRGWNVLTAESLSEYTGIYWDAYYSDAKEMFLNPGDEIGLGDIKAGKFYKLKKGVEFTIDMSNTNVDIVFWYKTKDGFTETKYIPNAKSVWQSRGGEEYELSNVFQMGKNTDYFGYFVVGEEYERVFTGSIPFESVSSSGEVTLEQKEFDVEEEILYTREDMLGKDTVLNVSEFLMLDGAYTIPDGRCYIKNDTEETVCLTTEDGSSDSGDLKPGSEVYVDSSIKSFTWRVVR